MSNWQNVLWREWRHTNDLEFAEHLFPLVDQEQTGWGTKISMTTLYSLMGASLGILIVAPITLQWDILQYLALAGAIVGATWGILGSEKLTWHDWLRRLEANSPADHVTQLLGTGLLLACVGGLFFGPIFWLMIVGIFWAIGDMILWINRSIETTSTYTPEDRRWWFWWRKRPSLAEVEAALKQACQHSPQAQKLWTDPLQRLNSQHYHSDSPTALVNVLFSKDWLDRFIAHHQLVNMGTAAVPALQELAANEEIPLHKTAQWLLKNIEKNN